MKQLGDLNTTTFFCPDCGISQRPEPGEVCPTCASANAYDWRSDKPVPVPLLVIFLAALLVLIVGIAAALRV